MHDVEIEDLGINTGAGFEPTSDEGMARITKMMLVSEGKATPEECEGFHYEAIER